MVQRIAVIGSGHLGSVTAACLAHIGHEVVGFESDPTLLAELREGIAPCDEPELDDLLADALEDGSLRFSGDLAEAMAGADIVFLCPALGISPDGELQTHAVRELIRRVATHITSYTVVVTKSILPVGTGRWVSGLMEDVLGPNAADLVGLVANPDFARSGTAVSDFLHPERVVLGSDSSKARRIATRVFRPIVEQRLPRSRTGRSHVVLLPTSLAAAEVIKYASSALHAGKMRLADEVARLCGVLEADTGEVLVGMGLDRRVGGNALDTSPGWGDADLSSALRVDFATPPLHAGPPVPGVPITAAQRRYVRGLARRHLEHLPGATICLFGLGLPALERDGQDATFAGQDGSLSAAVDDPHVTAVPDVPDIRLVPGAIRAATGADAIVLSTEWPQFLSLHLADLRRTMRGDLFFDGRNNFDPVMVERAGFRYVALGNLSSAPGDDGRHHTLTAQPEPITAGVR
jgi:UDPglucose 6-dehydrogenase